MVTDLRDPWKALRSIVLYLKQEYGLTNNKSENKTKLETKGFIFSDNIIRTTLSGNVSTLNELAETDNLNNISVSEPINTHIHGREYHNRVGRIGLEIGLEYSYMNTILGKLFAEKFEYHDKLLSLTTRQLYAFVINNLDLLRHVVREAMAVVLSQLSLDVQRVSEKNLNFLFQQCLLMIFQAKFKLKVLRMFTMVIYFRPNLVLHLKENLKSFARIVLL